MRAADHTGLLLMWMRLHLHLLLILVSPREGEVFLLQRRTISTPAAGQEETAGNAGGTEGESCCTLKVLLGTDMTGQLINGTNNSLMVASCATVACDSICSADIHSVPLVSDDQRSIE